MLSLLAGPLEEYVIAVATFTRRVRLTAHKKLLLLSAYSYSSFIQKD
jgi:hypothetical protein